MHIPLGLALKLNRAKRLMNDETRAALKYVELKNNCNRRKNRDLYLVVRMGGVNRV